MKNGIGQWSAGSRQIAVGRRKKTRARSLRVEGGLQIVDFGLRIAD